MELKSLKVLFLLICILDLSLSQYEEYDLDTTSPIQGNGDKTFLINLKSDKTYKDYTIKNLYYSFLKKNF